MKTPLVSIIVTCYNREGMVTRALDSIFAQTHRPLELVIIDDGSKDASWEVIQNWVARHPDGNGFTCKAQTFPNGKLCIARNRGLELSQGDFIQYVDDDDWLYPECISRKAAIFQADGTRDVVAHQVELINRKGQPFGTSRLTLASKDEQQLLHLLDTETETLFSPTLMFRRETLKAAGAWTPGLIFADDVDVVFRLAASGARFALVDEPLSAYNMHDAERQCNKVIYQLPDDFWTDLFTRLWDYFQGQGRDSREIREALAGQLDMYAHRQLRWGRFRSAWKGFQEASLIRGYSKGYGRLPGGVRHGIGFLDFLLHSGIRKGKLILKQIFMR